MNHALSLTAEDGVKGDGLIDYGFRWGPAEVTRCIEYRGRRVVLIETATVSIEVAISPQGNNIEVYKRGAGRLVPEGRREL